MTSLPQRKRDGEFLFGVQYLTRYIRLSPTISELKQDPVIQSASFIKSGAAGTIFPIDDRQAHRLFALLARENPDVNSLWPDLAARFVPDVDSIEMVATEGRTALLAHLARERDKGIVEAEKRAVLQAVGSLKCEACGFDFESV